jgi:hypothetical protein
MKLTPSTFSRLAGLCALCGVLIGGYRLKLAWWWSQQPGLPRGGGEISPAVMGVIAVAAAFGSWREKRWGYVLVLLLAAIENISAVHLHFSLEPRYRPEDLVCLALSGAPLTASMAAAVILLICHQKKASEQPPESAVPGVRGSP